MIRIGEVAMTAVAAARRRPGAARRAATLRRVALNLAGLVVFVVMVFPVYWMVATAFKPGIEITSYTPKWIPRPPDARPLHRRDPHARTSGTTSRTA